MGPFDRDDLRTDCDDSCEPMDGMCGNDMDDSCCDNDDSCNDFI